MTDDRPRPKYGEYAPLPPAGQAPPPPPAPRYPPPTPAEAAPVVTPRRTWDVALTAGLLLIAAWDVVSGFSQYANFAPVVRAAFEQQGFGDFSSDAAANEVGMVLNIIRIGILAVVIPVALVRLSRGRLAFWVPLAGGVLATVCLLVGMFGLILGDPGFSSYVDTLQ